MDTTPTPKTMHLREAARQKLIEYATMQARTGLQMVRNSIETDPRLTEEGYSTLLASLHAIEDSLAASTECGSPLTPSESAMSADPAP